MMCPKAKTPLQDYFRAESVALQDTRSSRNTGRVGYYCVYQTGIKKMDNYQLMIDLHIDANRQGPGGDAEVEKVLSLAMVDRTEPLRIADIGCGTGASTLLLARLLEAKITAVDFLPAFLEVLEGRAENFGLSEKITTLCCSMDNARTGN